MSQVESSAKINMQQTLRDVLHIVAMNSSPRDRLLALLNMITPLLDASGGGVSVFIDPPVEAVVGIAEGDVPATKALATTTASISEEFHILKELPQDLMLPGVCWIFAPLIPEEHQVGVLWLAFDHQFECDQSDCELLSVFIDAILIVARYALIGARYEKVGRNQAQFTRVVSHDLRSLLTSVMGYASVLESGMAGFLTDEQARYIDKVLTGSTQINSLVDNIHDAGRFDPDTGFYEMERRPCDVNALIEIVVSQYLIPADKSQLKLDMVLDDDVPYVNIDQAMMERAVANLVDNAVKYTPDGGRIEVRVTHTDNAIIIAVKDDGLGIDPENQTRLFERNIRLNRHEHLHVKGTGLGLFIVKNVARRHGGEAWVESEEGLGSTFFISIPLQGLNLINSEPPVA